MPRIAGIDVPDRKKILFALQYIHGIGPKFAADLLAEAQIDADVRANELSEQQIAMINQIIDSNYIVEGALRRQTSQNIQRLRDIRCYRGDRHKRGLPVHGQRTRCNARTRKGRKKTVAGKKGVKG
ncbi:MAG: 30S ribosomal protein S13 [Leptolyngbya sp. PLA3]|nr:MAG: 30S ribosomal protein S13 [Cyanobacteria bacterium CYA]MCE7969105.1 30S ribosomal protein S13 [Leptolyngbya sp. PL-A3]